jgi:hypothetical protein
MLITKPLTYLFNKVPAERKDAFFSPRRLKMAFAAGVLTYGVTAGCAYKMYEEISSVDEWHMTDLVSVNAVRKGGLWGVAAAAFSYVGDAALIYAGAGFLYRRRTALNAAKAPEIGEKPTFSRDMRLPQL